MPDLSSHAYNRPTSAVASAQLLFPEKSLTSPTALSDSSLQLFHIHSLLLPLPRGLRSLVLEHVSASFDNAPLDTDAVLSVSLTIHVDTSSALSTASTDGSDGEQSSNRESASTVLDWAAIVAQLHFITQHYPTSSLSTLGDVIAAYLSHSNQLNPHSPATSSPIRHLTLHLSITHPPHTISSSPSLSHSLTTAQHELRPPGKERNSWGEVDVLIETSSPSAGLYLLHLASGASIPSHVHRVMCEAEMVLTDGLVCQGVPAAWGAVHAWGDAVHGYTNASALPASVLCIDTPAFIPTDEIVVTGQALAAVEVQQAGQQLWQQLARSCCGDSGDTPLPSFAFPGCYAGQSCRLSFDRSTFQPADAVLLFVVSANSTSSLLFVRHRVRGLELPGGKVECGETDRQAAVRELREEAGLNVSEHTLQPIAQYTLTDADGGTSAPHTKSVFAAIVSAPSAVEAGHQWMETDAAEWRELPNWSSVLSESGWSVLLRDNVYAICSRVVNELWRQRERGDNYPHSEQ